MQSTQNQVTGTVATPAAVANVGRILRDAASYLAKFGWIRGAYYQQSVSVFTPPCCNVGAIVMVCCGRPVDVVAAQHLDLPGMVEVEAAVDFLDDYLTANGGKGVYEFNDAPGRTAEQVIATLNDAADDWDSATTTEDADELERVLRGVADMDQRAQGGA